MKGRRERDQAVAVAGSGWGGGWGGSVSHGEAVSTNLGSKSYCHYDLHTQSFHIFIHR